MQAASAITQSQRIYIVEVLFILLPVSLITALLIVFLSVKSTPLQLLTLPLFILAVFSSAWYLSYIFIKSGTSGLQKANFIPVLFCWLGALLALGASVATLFSEKYIFTFAFLPGAPALIPFMHIAYERHFKKMPNPSFKRDS